MPVKMRKKESFLNFQKKDGNDSFKYKQIKQIQLVKYLSLRHQQLSLE